MKTVAAPENQPSINVRLEISQQVHRIAYLISTRPPAHTSYGSPYPKSPYKSRGI